MEGTKGGETQESRIFIYGRDIIFFLLLGLRSFDNEFAFATFAYNIAS